MSAAYKRILKWVRITPIIRMQGPGARPVILKLEGFKIRLLQASRGAQ